MAVKNIRKRLYQAIMLPLAALFFIAAVPFVALSLLISNIWNTESINKALKYIIIAPLVVLYLPCAVLALGLHLSISTLLTVAKITLFPEFFLSLWIKEGIKFSRIFSLSITQFHNVDFYSYIEDSETFFKMKDSNRKLLVALLKDSDFSIQDDTPFHFYETHLGSVDKILEKPYKSSNKIEKTHKNLSSFIKSGKNAPKIFNFTKKTLNQMTFFVDMLIVMPLHFSIPFWWLYIPCLQDL